MTASCTLQIALARRWGEVCDFLAQPRHYVRWAVWLGPTLQQRGGEWRVRRPHGAWAKVRFCERNAYGVADHWLLEREDRAMLVALRVLPHGEGCEVVLTCFREAGCSDEAWSEQLGLYGLGLQALPAAMADPLYSEAVAGGAGGTALEGAAPSSAGKSRLWTALTAASQRPSAQRPCTPASS